MFNRSIVGAAAFMALCLPVCVVAQEVQFDIPSQPVAAAISMFGRQAGLQIVAPGDIDPAVRSQAVHGPLKPRDALLRLITGTGLEIASEEAGAIVLRRAPVSRSGTPPTEDAVIDLEEIVITAQKRDESALDVPISLTAFSGRFVEKFQLDTLRDVSRLTPGLLVSAFNQSSPTIAIRGASNTFNQIGANKPVAVVLDDLFIPRNSAAVFDLYGLNSVQVLKGPQGTLFGRNVTGGAVVLDTGKPSFAGMAGGVRLGAGNNGLRQVDGFFDLPVSGAAALRVAGASKRRDGFGRDRLTGREQDDLESDSARVQLRLLPSDQVEVLLGADYGEDGNGGRTLSSKGAGNDGNRRTSELGFPQRFDREQWGASARAYWTAPVGQFTSITGYRHSRSREDYSGSGASHTLLTGTATQALNTDADEVGLLSQELRYASPKWERGDFVVGAYLAAEDAERQLRAWTLRAQTGAVASNVLTDQSVDSRSYGYFADGTLRLPADLSLTLGARFTRDEKKASLVRTDAVNGANSFTAENLGAHWGEWTPRAVVAWAPSNGARIYGSVTRGYTAGGFNTDAATRAALSAPFDAETVTNYELGTKTRWFSGRLGVNLAVFRMNYEDKQELFFNNVTRVLTITNASEATVKGAELEIAWRPVQWLGLTTSYGYLDATYDEFIIPGGAVYTGNPLASTPGDKASVAADLDLPLGGRGYLIGAASWAYTGSYYTGASKDPNLHIDSYSLTNLMVGYESPSRAWRATAWVKNVGDVEYLLTPSTQSVLAEYLGEPRTWGLTVSLRF